MSRSRLSRRSLIAVVVGIGLAGCQLFCGVTTAHANTIAVSLTGADLVADSSCTLVEALTGGYAECAPTGPPGPLVISLPAGSRTWADADVLPPTISSNVIIRGAGAEATLLSSTSTGARLLFEIASGVVTIEGIGFEGWTGAGTFGGGVIRQRANTELTIRNCAFRNNDAGARAGGAISSGDDSGTHLTRLTIEGTTFEANHAYYAGAVWVGGATVSIIGSTFTNNTATSVGGAVRIVTAGPSQPVSITGTTFTGNSTTHPTEGNGGALTLEGRSELGGTFAVTDSAFVDNHAPGYGALWVSRASATIDGCRFEGNAATTSSGGALVVDDGVHLIDTVFVDNTAASSAGAFACQGTGLTCLVEGCRFENNVAENGSGGAIMGVTSELTITGSVFLGNAARLFTLAASALDASATEGADVATFVVDRRTFGSAIRHQAAGTFSGNCFLGATGHVVMGPVDARGNFWTSDDPTVRGEWGADTSGGLTEAPAGCDVALVPAAGEASFAASYGGTATAGVDYTMLPAPIVIPAGISSLSIDVVALPDGLADTGETVTLMVGDPETEFVGNASVTILDGELSDVAIAKTVDRTMATVGDLLTFTLTVTNTGPGAAANVVVTDALPTGLTLVDVMVSGPSGVTAGCIPGPPASCTLSSLAAGGSAMVTVVARAATAGEIVNRAEVSAASDTNAANDSSEVMVTVIALGVDGGPVADASASDGGGDAGLVPVTTTGCGCRAGADTGRATWLALGLAVALLARRRSRS
jgi:uncharacterized repeat protein (TIGR01451 family)/MYXO-CTERM domain-containing protein